MAHSPHAKHQRLGGKVGPRVAELVSKGMNDNLRRTAGIRTKLAAEGANEFFRGMSREKRQHTSPLWGLYLGHEQTPDELEKVLKFIATGQGELSEVMGSLGMGNVVGTSILSSIQNYLAPLNQQLIAALPNSLIDPGTVAAAHVRGFMETGAAQAEAAKGGINGHRLSILEHLAVDFPALPQLLELWRRGLISDVMVREALTKQGVSKEFFPGLLALKREHLGPADAALGVLRGWIDTPTGAEIAAKSGIDGNDFDLLIKNTGEPPGLMQLLEAYRRGFIDKARLDKGIRESRVRVEWIDVIEKLRFEPASTSDAARAVVQHHLTSEQGKQIAEWNGLRPEDWGWLIKTVGNPPGPMEMLSLLNRGQVSREGVEQALRESHIKDEYIPHIIQLKVKIPPLFQLAKMVERGAMSPKRGLQLLLDEGYEQDVAESLIHSATTGQTVKEKRLAAGEVQELYHDHAITRENAVKHLEAIGYHKANAEWLLSIIDLKRERTLQEAALSPIKSNYIAHHVNHATASGMIDKLGVPAAQRDYLLALWTVDREARKRTLSEAQIIAANVRGMFTDEVALQRLEGLGYSNEDSRILLDLEKGRTHNV